MRKKFSSYSTFSSVHRDFEIGLTVGFSSSLKCTIGYDGGMGRPRWVSLRPHNYIGMIVHTCLLMFTHLATHLAKLSMHVGVVDISLSAV